MQNCLVKTLKAAVTDTSLPIQGMMKLQLINSEVEFYNANLILSEDIDFGKIVFPDNTTQTINKTETSTTIQSPAENYVYINYLPIPPAGHTSSVLNGWILNLNDLKYLECPSHRIMQWGGGRLTGDFANIPLSDTLLQISFMNTVNAGFTDSSNCEHINNFPNIQAIWQERYNFIDFDKLTLTNVREFAGESKGEIMNWINSTIPSTYEGYITYMWPSWCTATLHGTRLSVLSSGDANPYSRIVLTSTKVKYYASANGKFPESTLVQEWDR